MFCERGENLGGGFRGFTLVLPQHLLQGSEEITEKSLMFDGGSNRLHPTYMSQMLTLSEICLVKRQGKTIRKMVTKSKQGVSYAHSNVQSLIKLLTYSMVQDII
jgi:hypothetical protein